MRLFIPIFFIMLLITFTPYAFITGIVDEQQVEVSGTISKNTTWSGDILVTDNVLVLEGVTLTIMPGSTVMFKHWRHGYVNPDHIVGLQVQGTLQAIGTAEEPIRFTSDAQNPEHGDWLAISFEEPATDQNILDHCIIEYAQAACIMAYNVNFTLSNSIVRWSTGGTVVFTFSSPLITHNRIYESGHGTIEMEDSCPIIEYNTLWGGMNGIWADSNSNPIIRNNIIRNNRQVGIGIVNLASATVENNTIMGNGDLGIAISMRSPASKSAIQYNNIYDNENMNLFLGFDIVEDIDATYNWWGTSDKQQIESKIHDSRDHPEVKATVFYEPYLTSEANIDEPTYDYENNERYAHVALTENDVYPYVFPEEDETRKVVDSWYPGPFPAGITWDGQYLWIATQSDKMINKFDVSGKLIESLSSPGPLPYGLAFDGQCLWCLDYAERLVYQIDLSGHVLKSISAPAAQCMGLTWDGQYLWTAPWHEAGKLYRFDVSGNTVKILQTPVGFRSGLAWDKGCLWVSSNGPDCKIYEIDPSDGHIIRVITGPAVRTFDMTWQGSDLWAVDWVAELGKDSRVFKIQVLEKATSSISIMVSTNQINKGESISISGSISPAVSGATVYLAYMKAGEVKVEKIVTTKSDGSFFHSYMPDAGGSWSVEARWEGNEQYQEAMSSPVNFECVDKGCIIATSTYGSELASEVQFLRSFREKTVYSTFAGASFMEVFNAFYYSWSPIVAAQIWKSETLKALGRVLITPLLSILHISTTVNSVFSFNPELAIVLTGLVASSLIGVVYFTPITVGALYAFKKKGNTLPKIGKLKFLFIPWITSLILIYLGEVIWSNVLLMIATGATIVFTIALTAAVLALKITRKLP